VYRPCAEAFERFVQQRHELLSLLKQTAERDSELLEIMAGIDVGDETHIRLEFDPAPRTEPMPLKLE
jgi:hypothetical protein